MIALMLALTLVQVRNEVDSRLNQFWTNQILPRQIQYVQTHPMGRYWQGLYLGQGLIPDNQDADPALVEFTVPDDDVTGIAGSHEVGWKAALPALPPTMGFGAVCDEWLSPAGIGFRVTVYVRYKGSVYSRSRAYLEDQSVETTPWVEVTP